MKTKQFFSLLLSFLLVAGCLAIPAGAVMASDSGTKSVVMRATGRIDTSIPGNTIMTFGEFSLDSGETVTFDCTYTPRPASVKFGYIGPDGYFYGLSGSNGSIYKGIRVSEPGSYTLAIWNKSDETVTVKGTVNY